MYRILLLLGVVTHTSFAFSQTDKTSSDVDLQAQCEKVMNYVAVTTERDFGPTPCADNVYSKAFWQCVDKKVRDESPFYLSVQYCERINH
jgi:hypothetical protein